MALAIDEILPAAPAPVAAGAPWVMILMADDAALEYVAGLAAIETFRPLIKLPHRVPQNRLSHAQRAAGTVIRLRPVPLFPRYVFLRGEWWDALDLDGVLGAVAGADALPLPIPAKLIDRIEAYQDDAGAVPSEVTPRRLLGLPAGWTVCPEREPRFCHVMSAALDQPLRTTTTEILVKLVAYCAGRP